MKAEPVAIVGGLTQIVTAVIGLLLIFDVIHWSTDQVGAVMAVWAAITSFALLWVRSQVTPVNNG